MDNECITTLKTDGYHRLKKDMEKKNTVFNTLVGSNLTYDGKYFEGGFTAVYNVFNKVLNWRSGCTIVIILVEDISIT